MVISSSPLTKIIGKNVSKIFVYSAPNIFYNLKHYGDKQFTFNKNHRKKLSEKLKKEQPVSTDVREGKTVFLRNLPFDVTQKGLENAIKPYGEFKYCLLVMNPETGFPKGTAFVQFKSKEIAEDCIKKMKDEATKLVFNGRDILACMAQGRKELQKQLKDREEEKKEKDKRHLYLATEGVVRPGSLAAIGLSEIELKKRMKMEMVKRAKLKDPNILVSLTRICFHNIPRSYDNAKLKKIIVDALKDVKDVHVTECRVMRDMKDVNTSGIPRSRGYAFINFTKHEHALLALRRLNNNPEVFGVDKRPIIEFSLENMRALEKQDRHRQKQLAKAAEAKQVTKKEEIKPSVKRKVRRIERLRAERRKKVIQNNNVTKERLPAVKQTKKAVEFVQNKRKSFEGASCLTSGGKKMRLSKRIGPKIRDRSRSNIIKQLKESKKLNKRLIKKPMKKDEASRNRWQPKDPNTVGFKQFQRHQQRTRKRANFDTSKKDGFDSLVAKYAKQFKSDKFFDQRSKWFNL